jgi:hypothetical protein
MINDNNTNRYLVFNSFSANRFQSFTFLHDVQFSNRDCNERKKCVASLPADFPFAMFYTPKNIKLKYKKQTSVAFKELIQSFFSINQSSFT